LGTNKRVGFFGSWDAQPNKKSLVCPPKKKGGGYIRERGKKKNASVYFLQQKKGKGKSEKKGDVLKGKK